MIGQESSQQLIQNITNGLNGNFLKFFEHGMAYKAKKNINWCPKCKMGLSNEDSSGGVCERCGTEVEQREKRTMDA